VAGGLEGLDQRLVICHRNASLSWVVGGAACPAARTALVPGG